MRPSNAVVYFVFKRILTGGFYEINIHFREFPAPGNIVLTY